MESTSSGAGMECPADSDLTWACMERLLMDNLRLYHHPLGVTFLFSDEEVAAFRAECVCEVPAKPLTYCQWELGARMQGRTVLGTADRLFCTNAQCSFGWREIDDGEVRSQLKYCRDEEQARRFLESKPRMPMGALKAVAVAPLGACRRPPHVVRVLCDAMQAYHLAVDYMAAMDVHPLPTQLLMSSSSCGGSVWCWQSGTFNFSTPCSGSYNAGKMERGETNVFIPGGHLQPLVRRMLERVGRCGSAAITRPGDFFPGGDICKNCPLILFKKPRAD
ncbi:MAG: DUF169 domain-containing protein [Desulfovibrionaceae bacterium]|nr:DUF169 domain-containing protein [Desulfovibrionaceae bacterium]